MVADQREDNYRVYLYLTMSKNWALSMEIEANRFSSSNEAPAADPPLEVETLSVPLSLRLCARSPAVRRLLPPVSMNARRGRHAFGRRAAVRGCQSAARKGPPCGAFSSVSVATLDALFLPRSIALIGADNMPRSVGGVLTRNLFAGGFDGPVMPVHPGDAAVHGVLAYRSVADLPVIPDLAIIASPPEDVPGLIADLGARGTRAVVVVSAGFDRAGPAAGAALRQGMLDAAKPHRLRIMGPACLGMMVPGLLIDATYAHARVRPGRPRLRQPVRLVDDFDDFDDRLGSHSRR